MILVYANVFWIRLDAIKNACSTFYNAGHVPVAVWINCLNHTAALEIYSGTISNGGGLY